MGVLSKIISMLWINAYNNILWIVKLLLKSTKLLFSFQQLEELVLWLNCSKRVELQSLKCIQGNIVMFSSDVSARGMDYEGVTLVLQVGLTDKEQYIHRLGRTARAGMEGQGIILVSPFESVILNQLSDLPIEAKSDNQVQAITNLPIRTNLSN